MTLKGKIKLLLGIICLGIQPTYAIITFSPSTPSPLSLSLASPATAETSLTLKELTTEDGFVLKAANAGKDIYLPIQSGWETKGIQLHLYLMHDPAVKHYDMVTALIKDFPISSVRLEPGDNKMTTWDITIPQKYLNGPVVTVQLRRNWQERGVACDNISDAIGWITVQGESAIDYQYVKKVFQPNLMIYPAPFINTMSLFKDKVYIVLPEQLDTNELESVYYVANSLYKRRTWRGLSIVAATFNNMNDDVKNNNIVIVGLASQIKPFLGNADTPIKFNDQSLLIDSNNKVIGDKRGVVMEIASPWNPDNAVLIVTGNTTSAVRKAADALRAEHFERWVIYNKYAFIDNALQINSQPIDWQDTTLSDLGYKDAVVYGTGANSIKYELNLPANKIPEGINITLHYAVSPLLSGINNSYLSLSVNDFPVTGKNIDVDQHDQTWHFHVDGRNLLPGKNILTFVFNLKFNDRDCYPGDLFLSWGTIYSDSNISVDFSNDEINYNFADLDGIDQNISLFIPKSNFIFTKDELIQLIINMATNITNIKEFNIYQDDGDIEAESKDSNIVYVGNMMDNPILNALKTNFPFCYVNRNIIIDPQILPYLHVSEERPIGLLELIKSPYHKNQLFLLITAESVNGFDLVADTFFNPLKNQYLRGNAALIYSDGTFTSIDTNKLNIKAQNEIIKNKINNAVWWVFIACIIAFFGAMILLILLRRAKRYFSRNPGLKDHIDDK